MERASELPVLTGCLCPWESLNSTLLGVGVVDSVTPHFMNSILGAGSSFSGLLHCPGRSLHCTGSPHESKLSLVELPQLSVSGLEAGEREA